MSYNTVATINHPTLPWVAQITSDTQGKSFLKFYNTREGVATGPWMALPVVGEGGVWSLGDRADFEVDLTTWLSAISDALTEAGIDHLG
jgi:hypothetical protein